jgi:uncharacterized protein (TIGR02996 family)
VSDAVFLQQLDLHPDDNTLRLVYADWLDDRDDPRGPLLRAAVALRTRALTNEQEVELRRTIIELRSRVSAGWLVRALCWYAEDDVREVVFRSHFGKPGPGSGYLFVDGTDPSWYLFGRLAADYPGIQPGSARKPRDGAEPDFGSGTVYSVDGPRWVGELSGDVDFGVVSGPLMGHGTRHRVELRGEEWVITDSRGTWIS